MIKSRNNSSIFRDVFDEDQNTDLTYIGIVGSNFEKINLEESNHGFILGDAIYYDINTNHYYRALAVNTVMSEVIGVVSKVIDNDNFELTLKGNIILDRYNTIQNDKPLYLSPIITGKLTEIEPNNISKIIAVKIQNGIKVDIQRGYHLIQSEEPIYDDIRYYTEQEIQDIINTIKSDIY